MLKTNEMIDQSVAYLKGQINQLPDIALILGSGLGPLGENLENPTFIPYEDIPYFKSSTAPGHMGRFIIGELQGKTVLCMQGRLHYYEGYTRQEITHPIRVM